MYLALGLLGCLCLSITRTTAQPIITDQVVFALGETAPVSYLEGSFAPGPAGANVTWDFSGLSGSGVSFAWEALEPINTPFADSFPSATLAFLFPDTTQTGTSENWIYYRMENSVLDLLGTTSVLTENGGADTVYSLMNEDPDELFQFPFTYGDSASDPVAGKNIAEVSGFKVVQDRTGTTRTVVDGYGTLITPAGTFQNAVRVKRIETLQDNFMGSVTTQHFERYDWFVPGEKYILMHMEESTITPPFGPGSSSVQIYYRSGSLTGTGLESNLAQEWQFNVYPNPARDQLTVSLNYSGEYETATLSLLDLKGKVHRQQALTLTPYQPLERSWNVSDLPAGYYLLRLSTQSGQASLPILIP